MPSIEELKRICQDRPDKHDFYMWGVIRKISIYFTWIFVRSPTTPNQITMLSIIFGLIGSSFFLSPNPWYWVVGWFVINLHLILDQCDGEVAYYKKNITKFGYFFDQMSHPIVNTFFFLMLTIGVYNMTNNILYLILGGSLVLSLSAFYRMVGLYEAHIKKEMFKIKTKKIDMPKSWIRRIVGMPRGLGGYFHVFLVAAVLDIAAGDIFSPSINFRVIFLVVVGACFLVVLIKRIYNLKKRLKDEKL